MIMVVRLRKANLQFASRWSQTVLCSAVGFRIYDIRNDFHAAELQSRDKNTIKSIKIWINKMWWCVKDLAYSTIMKIKACSNSLLLIRCITRETIPSGSGVRCVYLCDGGQGGRHGRRQLFGQTPALLGARGQGEGADGSGPPPGGVVGHAQGRVDGGIAERRLQLAVVEGRLDRGVAQRGGETCRHRNAV